MYDKRSICLIPSLHIRYSVCIGLDKGLVLSNTGYIYLIQDLHVLYSVYIGLIKECICLIQGLHVS